MQDFDDAGDASPTAHEFDVVEFQAELVDVGFVFGEGLGEFEEDGLDEGLELLAAEGVAEVVLL